MQPAEGLLTLDPEAASVGAARRFVRRRLSDVSAHEELVETAALIVSELVTNAVVHAGTPLEVSVRADRDVVRVEVSDGSPRLPSRRDYAVTAGTGRGMELVEQLADAWGADLRTGGKTVWFELGHPSRRRQRDHASEGVVGSRDSLVVELPGLPVLLHLAWQQHVQALLREYLLSTLHSEHGGESMRAHAAASDALSLLAANLPRPRIGSLAEDLMAASADPATATVDATVPVPRSSVPHFGVLDRLVEQAIAAADLGTLMTPPTQPEMRSLRRWLCRQVQRQSEGLAPTGWDEEEPPPMVEPLARDSGSIPPSDEAVVVADDTDRIVALTPAAVDLLGYDGPGDLVGRRLLAIIPERYHQAHLAGFTLHLYAGRDALVDTTTTVPVVRADGSECPVRLTLTARHVAGGRALYSALLEG